MLVTLLSLPEQFVLFFGNIFPLLMAFGGSSWCCLARQGVMAVEYL
jgi:hypothetical protein